MTEPPVSIVETLVTEALRERRHVRGTRYPREFRRDVAHLILDGQTDAKRMSTVIGVNAYTIKRWVSEELAQHTGALLAKF
jgi:transposase-like protein